MRIHHLAVQVSDLKRAVGFWHGVLGLREVRRQAHSVWLDAGGTVVMLEICRGNGEPPAPFVDDRAGLHLVAFAIAPQERSSLRARLTAAGIAIEGETAFTMYVRDPDGTRVGLSHYPDPAPEA